MHNWREVQSTGDIILQYYFQMMFALFFHIKLLSRACLQILVVPSFCAKRSIRHNNHNSAINTYREIFFFVYLYVICVRNMSLNLGEIITSFFHSFCCQKKYRAKKNPLISVFFTYLRPLFVFKYHNFCLEHISTI